MQTSEKDIQNYLELLKKRPNGAFYNEQKNEVGSESLSKQEQLDILFAPFEQCLKCPLSELGRNKVVFGSGNPDAQLMFIGEGPGRDEDKQGLPFVGRAGKLLTKIIEAMGLNRAQDVYITNVVKCRPPNNRAPTLLESSTCKDLLLFKQIQIIKPKIICLLGSSAAHALFGTEMKIGQVRGRILDYQGIPVLPTYHPAYLLRNPSAKNLVWEDVQKIFEFTTHQKP